MGLQTQKRKNAPRRRLLFDNCYLIIEYALYIACWQIREYTHGFFSNTATALKEDFNQYLAHVVPLAFDSLNLDDGLIFGEGSDDEDQVTPKTQSLGLLGFTIRTEYDIKKMLFNRF